MKLRDEYSANHSWLSAVEEQEAKKAFDENRRTVWRRMRPSGGASYNSTGGAGGDLVRGAGRGSDSGGRGGRGGLLGKRGRGGSAGGGGGAFGTNRRGGGPPSAFPGTYYGNLEGEFLFFLPFKFPLSLFQKPILIIFQATPTFPHRKP